MRCFPATDTKIIPYILQILSLFYFSPSESIGPKTAILTYCQISTPKAKDELARLIYKYYYRTVSQLRSVDNNNNAGRDCQRGTEVCPTKSTLPIHSRRTDIRCIHSDIATQEK